MRYAKRGLREVLRNAVEARLGGDVGFRPITTSCGVGFRDLSGDRDCGEQGRVTRYYADSSRRSSSETRTNAPCSGRQGYTGHAQIPGST